ncbi:GNAT family N-acetyltransferase [Reinekea sp.]|jgi:ribosomal protein S18 acetylase RimI-like enzyme|uniref:GNAT family N-acetyltransferase n=1 Tax=Reinekea sp. TaxID=1970455 RepID=UPI003988E37A
MKLIPFEPKDAAGLNNWFKTKDESLTWGGRIFGWPLSLKAIISRSNCSEAEFYVLTDQNQMVGFFEIQQISKTEQRLCRVVIAPYAQGRGFGKRLIELAIAQAKEKSNAQSISLAVFQANQVAFNCYQSLGFRVVEREPAFKVFEGVQWPLYQMELTLI